MSNKLLQQKVKVLMKLFDCGCTTEKELQALSMETILKIPGITISDMTMIIDLKTQVKANKLYSYLGLNEDKEE